MQVCLSVYDLLVHTKRVKDILVEDMFHYLEKYYFYQKIFCGCALN